MSGGGGVVAEVIGFVPSEDGSRWTCAGALTFDNAAAVCAAAGNLPLPSRGIVECSGLSAVDSSAVAVLLSLKRRASQEGVSISFENMPSPLRALAMVYGVDEILTAAEAVASS